MGFMPGSVIALTVVLLLLALFLWITVSWLVALAMLRPPRMTSVKATFLLHRLSPDDLNLPYEAMDFTVRDAGSGLPLRLAAWFIPAPRSDDRCAVLVHGYADAKVGAIAWAPLLHELGLNVLALDLRAHGESDGRYCTAGFFERHDLSQVLDQLRTLYPQASRRIVLMGISMGAAVVAAAAVMRRDLAGVILESPFTDHARAALVHARLQGLPGKAFLRLARLFARRISGADFDQVRP